MCVLGSASDLLSGWGPAADHCGASISSSERTGVEDSGWPWGCVSFCKPAQGPLRGRDRALDGRRVRVLGHPWNFAPDDALKGMGHKGHYFRLSGRFGDREASAILNAHLICLAV